MTMMDFVDWLSLSKGKVFLFILSLSRQGVFYMLGHLLLGAFIHFFVLPTKKKMENQYPIISHL